MANRNGRALTPGTPAESSVFVHWAAAPSTADAQNVSLAEMRTALGSQPSHANLSALAGLTGAADRLAYFTDIGAMALATLTAFGRSLVAAADQGAARTALGAPAAASPTFTGLMKVEAVKGTASTASTAYTVAAGDSGKMLVATAAITVTIPVVTTLCPNADDLFRLEVHNDSAGNVVLDGPGATNLTLAAGEWGTVYARNGGKIVAAKGATTVLS